MVMRLLVLVAGIGAAGLVLGLIETVVDWWQRAGRAK